MALSWETSKKRVALEAPDTDIKEICKELLPQWHSLNDAEIEISVISGGITNALFKATAASVDPVVVRVYGVYTEKLIDRQQELNFITALSPSGFGPKVLGTFANGRLEGYLDSRPLEPDEMGQPTAVEKIAARLAAFHTASVPTAKSPTMFQKLEEWIELAAQTRFPDEAQQKLLEDRIDVASLKRDLPAIQDAVEALHSPIVFCHNDLLSGNILLLRAPGEALTLEHSPMTFIDFEYSGYGYRGFDFGNHFNEYAGFEGDFEACYPTVDTQRRFFESYLRHSANGENVAERPTVASLIHEATAFAALSHLYWGVWGIIQARYSTIDFDFLNYAAGRLGHFRKGRGLILKEA